MSLHNPIQPEQLSCFDRSADIVGTALANCVKPRNTQRALYIFTGVTTLPLGATSVALLAKMILNHYLLTQSQRIGGYITTGFGLTSAALAVAFAIGTACKRQQQSVDQSSARSLITLCYWQLACNFAAMLAGISFANVLNNHSDVSLLPLGMSVAGFSVASLLFTGCSETIKARQYQTIVDTKGLASSLLV